MVHPRVKARLEARIKERTAHCLEFELSDPRASFLTVTRVELSDDLSTAKVHYSVYGTDSDKSRVAHMLEDATGFVRKKVARVLETRRVPMLKWYYDDSVERLARMNDTIQDALEKDRAINPAAHAERPREAPAAEPPDAELEREYLDFLRAKEDEGEDAPPSEPQPR